MSAERLVNGRMNFIGELVFERFDFRLEPINVLLRRDGLGRDAGQSLGGRARLLLREPAPPEMVDITELIEKNWPVMTNS